jgi:uncharacterized membrane protein (DUF485 family)
MSCGRGDPPMITNAPDSQSLPLPKGTDSPVQNGATVDIHGEAFLHSLMRRQLRLSIACAATFLIALLGLPLTNYFFPEFMARRVLGFTLSWFVLGVLFFPLVWAIAWVFIRRSIALEDAEVREVLESQRGTDLSLKRQTQEK